MHINISLDGTEGANQLHALAMLIASLGGRTGPMIEQLHDELMDGKSYTVTHEERPAATAPPIPAPLAPPPPPNGDNGISTAPAPSPSAPPPPPASPSATPPSNEELDSKGLPWDERIHSSSKEKIGDGSWRMKRGVDKSIVPTVEAELRARVGGAVPLIEQAPPAPPVAPAAAPTAPAAPAATPAAEPTAPPPPPAPSAVDNGSKYFADMPAFVTFVSSKAVPYAELGEKAVLFGKSDFQGITKDPATWDGFVEAFGWSDMPNKATA